ncbi:MAG: zf-TFIIB domain-containing protein, partial [Candidatus Eisenbacteria bacterium]|nr:zf-TFIIB domain-containing protein [Candidatus Eisenbacteria bacterium]
REEDSPTEGGGSSVASERPSASASADEAGIDEDEADAEDETEEADEEDEADEGESIYDRFDDPRVRRKELDRERIDREEESQGEGFWMICPKCGDHLEEVESDGVKIDRCEGCGGIYLDRGELEMLLTFARGRRGHTRVRSILQV